MKNLQKGFALPLLLILIAALLIGGGAYVYEKNKPASHPVTASTTSQTGATTQTSNSQTSDWKTYTNTTYGYEIKYPASFVAEPENDGTYVSIHPVPQPKEFGPSLSVTVSKAGSTSLDAQVNSFLNESKSVVERNSVGANGIEWAHIIWKDISGAGPEATYESYFASKNGYVYRVINTKYTNADNIFGEIVKTIKFIP